MSGILTSIKADLGKAVKERDSTTVEALRFLLSAVHNEEIARQKELTDKEVLAVLQREMKKREESITAFRQGGREDLAQKEEKEKTLLTAYLPPQLSEEEIRKVIQEIINSGVGDFGPVMGQAMGRLKGQADGVMVTRIVKEELNSD